MAWAAPAAWAQQAPVARVAVAVGETLRVAPSGQTQALQVGSSLTPGDRVRTGPDAVAVLVFADEGHNADTFSTRSTPRHTRGD